MSSLGASIGSQSNICGGGVKLRGGYIVGGGGSASSNNDLTEGDRHSWLLDDDYDEEIDDGDSARVGSGTGCTSGLFRRMGSSGSVLTPTLLHTGGSSTPRGVGCSSNSRATSSASLADVIETDYIVHWTDNTAPVGHNHLHSAVRLQYLQQGSETMDEGRAVSDTGADTGIGAEGDHMTGYGTFIDHSQHTSYLLSQSAGTQQHMTELDEQACRRMYQVLRLAFSRTYSSTLAQLSHSPHNSPHKTLSTNNYLTSPHQLSSTVLGARCGAALEPISTVCATTGSCRQSHPPSDSNTSARPAAADSAQPRPITPLDCETWTNEVSQQSEAGCADDKLASAEACSESVVAHNEANLLYSKQHEHCSVVTNDNSSGVINQSQSGGVSPHNDRIGQSERERVKVEQTCGGVGLGVDNSGLSKSSYRLMADSDLVKRISADIVRMSQHEPLGTAGCLVRVYLETSVLPPRLLYVTHLRLQDCRTSKGSTPGQATEIGSQSVGVRYQCESVTQDQSCLVDRPAGSVVGADNTQVSPAHMVTTSEVILTLKEEGKRWHGVFDILTTLVCCVSQARFKKVYISPAYRLEKIKLYRSPVSNRGSSTASPARLIDR